MIRRTLLAFAAVLSGLPHLLASTHGLHDLEQRFAITLFAETPQIVNPIGVQVGSDGSVYVIESHTHFPPLDYKGPKADRILRICDTDNDGRVDKVDVFYDGLQAAMDIALADNGEMYVVTRAAVYRLRDTNGVHKADEATLLVRLETSNNYPHNALSGLALDGHGGFYFGLGENFGAAYKLIGADHIELTGQGEGGRIYHCQLDGTKLRRVATGFWNPFGLCLDRVGRLFATDNDPDSSPPCRLLHIVDGGDYGYEVRYGRDGLHPFQCWNGELPGTLPMITGTGEAPCKVVPYDGGLLVASWADNRLEHYTLKKQGESFGADQKVLISGDMNFRPVGIGVGADGTLYVSDWGSASYELTDAGRIWRLQPKRPVDAGDGFDETPSPTPTAFDWKSDREAVLRGMDSGDPFVRCAAINAAAADEVNADSADSHLTPSQRVGLLLAQKRSGHAPSEAHVVACLNSDETELQVVMLKWIADRRLTQFTKLVEWRLDSSSLTPATLTAYLSTLEMLREGQISAKGIDSARLVSFVSDDRRTPQLRAYALRMVRPDAPELTAGLMKSLAANPDSRLRLEAVQKASVLGNSECRQLLETIARDDAQAPGLRATAIDGLSGIAANKNQFLELAAQSRGPVRAAALRALVGIELNKGDVQQLATLDSAPEASRLLHRPSLPRPPLENLDAWLKLIDEKQGDADNGRHIFFHPIVGACSRCHAAEGRGNRVGPDLSHVGRTPRQEVLRSILQPSRDVAPGFRQWLVETSDGLMHSGIPLRKGSENEDYLGTDGNQFSLPTADIVARREVSTSIMPDGLTAQLTNQELADLLAFLASQK